MSRKRKGKRFVTGYTSERGRRIGPRVAARLEELGENKQVFTTAQVSDFLKLKPNTQDRHFVTQFLKRLEQTGLIQDISGKQKHKEWVVTDLDRLRMFFKPSWDRLREAELPDLADDSSKPDGYVKGRVMDAVILSGSESNRISEAEARPQTTSGGSAGRRAIDRELRQKMYSIDERLARLEQLEARAQATLEALDAMQVRMANMLTTLYRELTPTEK